MTSLILTVISILLLGAISVATVKYMPSWSQSKADTSLAVRSGAAQLERAYELYARAHGGAGAAATGAADGGLSQNFSPFLRFVPAAVPGYRWVYGVTGSGAAPGYQNTAFFCMTPITPGAVASEGKVRGAVGARGFLSEQQAFVAPQCGVTGNANYTSFPARMSFTYFVRHVPGQI